VADPVLQHLAGLGSSSKTDLCQLWQQFFKTAPHAKMRKSMLVRFLAHSLQQQAHGGLSARTQERLRQLARSFESNPQFEPSAMPRLRPGTRLVREWKGQVHVVTTGERGYEYRGRNHDSLSEIARLITGTRWSGPLFFGLKRKPAVRGGVK